MPVILSALLLLTTVRAEPDCTPVALDAAETLLRIEASEAWHALEPLRQSAGAEAQAAVRAWIVSR